LRRGCTPADLRKAYRALVRRWHPDRFVSDPVGQVEASTRLREINGAFRVVAEDVAAPGVRVSGAADERASSTWAARAPREPGRPLSRAEIDAIVGALANDGPVDTLLAWFSVLWPFAVGFAFLVQPLGSPLLTMLDKAIGLGFVGFGVVSVVRAWWPARRRSRPTPG
jgi:hypothetical protein